MKTLTTSIVCACFTLAAGAVAAQDAMKKADPMAAPKPMTMQDCTDYMAAVKKDAMKKDAKKETTCTDMMAKEKAKK